MICSSISNINPWLVLQATKVMSACTQYFQVRLWCVPVYFFSSISVFISNSFVVKRFSLFFSFSVPLINLLNQTERQIKAIWKINLNGDTFFSKLWQFFTNIFFLPAQSSTSNFGNLSSRAEGRPWVETDTDVWIRNTFKESGKNDYVNSSFWII